MSIFKNYNKREELINRAYSIDISLYEKLESLSINTYDASITKLFNTCLENLIKTKQVDIYKRNPGEISVSRSFLIRKSLYEELVNLKNEYNLSLNKLVNIAIYNALVAEGLIKG